MLTLLLEYPTSISSVTFNQAALSFIPQICIRFDPTDAGVVPKPGGNAGELVFEVPCEEGPSWPSSINWPECIVETCEGALPNWYTNFSAVDTTGVKVGEKVRYQCKDSTQVRRIHVGKNKLAN